MNPVSKTFQWGRSYRPLLETGRIARQATGAVLVTMDQTQVLCTVVAAKSAKPGQDFFPTVCALPRTAAMPWAKSRVVSSSVKVVRQRKKP